MRTLLKGLIRNGAFLTATFGMAAYTFAMGGMQVWIPTFLVRLRGLDLKAANIDFSIIVIINGIGATLLGGWLGDRLLRRFYGAYYSFSGIAMLIAVPFMVAAIYVSGSLMLPAMFVAVFFVLVGTGPTNAALVNSVSANIRSTALAVNVFIIHLLGDAFSPTLIGRISDKTGFFADCFLGGVRRRRHFRPHPSLWRKVCSAIPGSGSMIVFDWTLLFWISGLLLALIWLVPALQLALHSSEVADLTQPEWNPPQDSPLPSLTIVVPARNEEAEIEAALRSLLQLNYPRYQIVAVNDRSTDQTGAIMERLAAEPAAQGKLRVIHVRDLPSGWLGKVHAMWLGSQINGSQRNAPGKRRSGKSRAADPERLASVH